MRARQLLAGGQLEPHAVHLGGAWRVRPGEPVGHCGGLLAWCVGGEAGAERMPSLPVGGRLLAKWASSRGVAGAFPSAIRRLRSVQGSLDLPRRGRLRGRRSQPGVGLLRLRPRLHARPGGLKGPEPLHRVPQAARRSHRIGRRAPRGLDARVPSGAIERHGRQAALVPPLVRPQDWPRPLDAHEHPLYLRGMGVGRGVRSSCSCALLYYAGYSQVGRHGAILAVAAGAVRAGVGHQQRRGPLVVGAPFLGDFARRIRDDLRRVGVHRNPGRRHLLLLPSEGQGRTSCRIRCGPSRPCGPDLAPARDEEGEYDHARIAELRGDPVAVGEPRRGAKRLGSCVERRA
mmetsp:Transcript_100128/g.289082  ORF Transcript_100128/g.289082 Transcript_100128/m.289082 type:complete len:345 (-) Transcript_100128:270-1304(-)